MNAYPDSKKATRGMATEYIASLLRLEQELAPGCAAGPRHGVHATSVCGHPALRKHANGWPGGGPLRSRGQQARAAGSVTGAKLQAEPARAAGLAG